jgi:hypothetical protein
MVRKTREQVWRELEDIGEHEVRQRLAAASDAVEEPGLVREWLAQRDRVASALAATSDELATRHAGRTVRLGRVVGSAALLAVAAVALGFLLARRKR